MDKREHTIGRVVLRLWIAVALLFFGGMPVMAADSGSCGENATWSYEDDTETLTISGTGAMTDYTIKTESPHMTEYSQGVPWAGLRMGIRKIVVEEGITTIGRGAFSFCDDVTDIQLPQSLQSIEERAFYSCSSLKNIDIPDTVTTIQNCAFTYCSCLETVDCSETLESIGDYVFYNCRHLEKVTIRSRETEIGRDVFKDCSESLVIYGYSGTAAEENAALYERGFVALDPKDEALYVDWMEPDPAQSQKLGKVVRISARALGGVQPIQYRFYYKDQDGTEHSIRDYSYHPNAPWRFSDAGIYRLGVRVKDAEGNYVEKEISNYVIQSFADSIEKDQLPMISSKKNRQDYKRYGSVPTSYLFDNGDHTFSRVEYDQGKISVERYDNDFQFQSAFRIPFELSIFGGFYAGKDYNFIVFGQPNQQEEDSVEVVRVVRYTKDWQRVDAVSLYGANTSIPFDAGSLRMTEWNGSLYAHTCHTMYATPDDGLNHQANMFFSVDIENMEITEACYGILYNRVYVSHSFNQYVLADDTGAIRVLDHGDGFPRALAIGGYEDSTTKVIFPIQGGFGSNDTGVSVGGFEYSGSSYLAAGNSVDQSSAAAYDAEGVRNIFVTATDRSTGVTEVHWLTAYDKDSGVEVSTPHLVKVKDDRFLVLWTEGTTFKYTFVDGAGNSSGTVYEDNTGICLSDCKPVLSENRVVWYVTDQSAPVFYSIDLEDPSCIGRQAPLSYSISYHLDGGENSAENPEQYQYGTELQLAAPVKTGYQFEGWYADAEYAEPVTVIPAGNDADVELYAKWSLIAYSIWYLDKEGQLRDTGSYTVETETFTLTNPEKTGYDFAGWTNSELETPQKEVTIPKGSTGNRFYRENWTLKSYKLTYHLNGGENHADNPADYTYGSSQEFGSPVRNGYRFDGWYTDEELTDRITRIYYGMYGDLDLYAKWIKESYSLEYMLNQGQVSGNPASYTIETDTFTLVNPTRDGYAFAGWTGTELETPQKEVTIERGSVGDRRYVANWTPASYTITYHLDGGENHADNPAGYTYRSYHSLYTPVRGQDVFDGWYTDETFANRINVIDYTMYGDLDLYAKWITEEYTLKYILNGGEESGNLESYTAYTETFTLKAPTRGGYEFTGWTGSGIAVPQKEVTIEKGSKGNKTYTANWTPISYTITYHLDGGENHADNPDRYTCGTAQTLKNPARNTYTFVGWYTDAEWTNRMNSISGSQYGDLELYARWKETEYSLRYELAGGTVTGNPAKYTAQTETFTLVNPTRDGYEFTGWTSDANEVPELEVTIEQGSTGKRTYRANWNPLCYTISYHLDGGGNSPENPETYTFGKYQAIMSPVRSGYQFDGWYANPEFTKKITSISSTTYGSLDLYAKWSLVEYYLLYRVDGATPLDNPDHYTVESDTFTLKNPERTGFQFAGWTDSESSVPQMEVVIPKGSTGDHVYTANWTPQHYTITYHMENGENAAGNPAEYVYGEAEHLYDPVRTGYMFGGWYTDETHTQRITQISSYMDGNVDLYAAWTAELYTIQYDLNGGVDGGNPGVYTVMTDAFTLIQPERTGYTFTGWTGSGISDPQKDVIIEKGSTGDRVYTANWEQREETPQGAGSEGGTQTGEDSQDGNGDSSQSGSGDSTQTGSGGGVQTGTGDNMQAGTGGSVQPESGSGSQPEIGDDTQSGTGDSGQPGSGDGIQSGMGDGTQSGSGDGIQPGMGDGTRSGSGDSSEPGIGDGTQSGSGDGIQPGMGDGTQSGSGDGSQPGMGDSTQSGSGDSGQPGSRDDTRSGNGDGSQSGTGDTAQTKTGDNRNVPLPKGTSISKLKAVSKGIKVTWKKQKKDITGYEIQYSTSRKFTGSKKVVIKKQSKTSYTIKKLKAKKKYYVRIRTYKTVNGKKYYSGWSKAKNTKTKVTVHP